MKYYDETLFNGEFEFDEVPFRKQQRYSHQNEYRIVVDTKNVGKDPLDMSIGNISAFCLKVRANTLNEVLKFSSLPDLE